MLTATLYITILSILKHGSCNKSMGINQLVPLLCRHWIRSNFNPFNTELNPICHLLALLAHHILHVSTIRVNGIMKAVTL